MVSCNGMLWHSFDTHADTPSTDLLATKWSSRASYHLPIIQSYCKNVVIWSESHQFFSIHCTVCPMFFIINATFGNIFGVCGCRTPKTVFFPTSVNMAKCIFLILLTGQVCSWCQFQQTRDFTQFYEDKACCPTSSNSLLLAEESLTHSYTAWIEPEAHEQF